MSTTSKYWNLAYLALLLTVFFLWNQAQSVSSILPTSTSFAPPIGQAFNVVASDSATIPPAFQLPHVPIDDDEILVSARAIVAKRLLGEPDQTAAQSQNTVDWVTNIEQRVDKIENHLSVPTRIKGDAGFVHIE